MSIKSKRMATGLNTWLVSLFVLTSFLSCAQSKKVVKKVQAFYVERLPGNIPSVPSLINRDSIVTIYAETTSKDITWDTAWKGNSLYLVRATLIEEIPHQAGVAKTTGEKIMLHPAKGLFLWQLYLEMIEQPEREAGTGNSPGDQILIRGTYKGKKLSLKVTGAVELEGIPSV